MKLATRLGTVLAAAVLMVGVLPAASASASAAAADGKYCMMNMDTYIDVWLTEGCFIGYDDQVMARDIYSDGMRSVTEWYTNYGRSGECHNTHGSGWSVYCDYDMSETGRVKFRSCARDGASAPNYDCTAWSPWISISTGEPV